MTGVQNFHWNAEQIIWLEHHLPTQPNSEVESGRLEQAVKALVCARAVIEQLAQISTLVDVPDVSTAV